MANSKTINQHREYLLMTFVPQPEDLSYADEFSNEAPYKQSDLLNKPSPVLPLHFDKAYLPKNICQQQYLQLFDCMIFRPIDKTSVCSFQVSRFEICKKNRDLQILDGIKKWETKHVASLDKNNRNMYLQGLAFKLDRLKEQYGKTPSTQAKQYKLQRLEAEIAEIKWRTRYIKQIINS